MRDRHAPTSPLPHRRSLVSAVVALLLAGFLTADTLQAQQRGSLVGSVTDEVSGEPLVGAVVSATSADGQRAETDEDGRFLFPDLPVGAVSIRTEHPGYGTVIEQVEVSPSDVVFLRIRLPRVEALLDEILVRAGARDEPRGDVSRPDSESRTAADILAQEVPGVHISWGDGNVGSGATIRIRGISTLFGSNEPIIILDGVRIDSRSGAQLSGLRSQAALHALETIPADAVSSIRVLKGPASAGQYADGANGVILVETLRGDEGQDDDD